MSQHATCRYLAYREPHDHPDEDERYSINKIWLHVFAARLGFIVIFEVRASFAISNATEILNAVLGRFCFPY